MECLLEFATPSQEKLNCFQSKADGIFRKLHLRHLYCRYEAGGGLRNRIIHDHESINLRFIWEIITEDILELREITKAPLCRKIGVLHQGVIIWGNGNGQIARQTWHRCRTGRPIQKQQKHCRQTCGYRRMWLEKQGIHYNPKQRCKLWRNMTYSGNPLSQKWNFLPQLDW